jgi:site-specific DNA recombinase
MAERRGHDRSVQFEHAFDRLLAVKLEQVYAILVPEWGRAIGVDQSVRGKRDEGCRDLRQSIFRAAEAGEHDRQSDGGADRFAREQGYSVPDDWVIEDEGFSGASLLRPGLERLRDLAAEGHIQAVLIHSPDRLSRKYAYQVLLTEEFARHGVETIFLKAPHSDTPEDQLMVQFQGMIIEYERGADSRTFPPRQASSRQGRGSLGSGWCALWLPLHPQDQRGAGTLTDRCRRSRVVRLVYDKYTAGGLSIGAIARLLRGMGSLRVGGFAGNHRSSGRSCATRPIRERPALTGRGPARGKS